MIPILFDPAETEFADIRRALTDAQSCTVRQDTEGRDELTLSYPVGGAHFAEIGYNSLILAKPNPWLRAQPYRVYAFSKPISGLVSVSARHLSYDALGIPVGPFAASGAADAAAKLKSNALVNCPFTLETDSADATPWAVETPASLRELAVTADTSWLHTYGGGLEFDRWTIRLKASPGTDRNVTLRYGVDLVDLTQQGSVGEVYTGVLPFWSGNTESGAAQIVLGSVQSAAGSFAVPRIMPLDLSAYFDAAPTAAQLNTLGAQYVTRHNLGVPEVSLTMRYADIGQDVRLHDTVGVEFAALGVSTRAPVCALQFDVLNEIYTTAEIGTLRKTITDSLGDASRLTHNTVPPGAIGGNSISEKALAAYAVTKQKLAALAVGTPNIEQFAVTGGSSGKIALSTLTTANTSSGINTSLGWADFWSNVYYGNVVSQWIKATYLKIGNWEFTPTAVSYKDGDGVTRSRVFLTAT